MTCLGCWRCEDESNLRTLRNGNKVCSWCDCWKNECADYEAKAKRLMALNKQEMAQQAKILESNGYDLGRIKKIILRLKGTQ